MAKKRNLIKGKTTRGNNFKRQAKKDAARGNYQDAFSEEEKSKESYSRKYPMGKASPNNDASWYAKNPQLLKDTASFSYNNPLGAPFRLTDYFSPVSSGQIGLSYSTSTVPGLMAFAVGLTPGLAVDAASPINIAAINVYDYVRYKNSGSANYDAPDYMLYLLAMDSLYSAWNWMKRLYGLISSFSQLNRYMPLAYAAANGVDFDDLRANMANFRGYINSVAARISAFCVPATMNYMVRHSWMFSNVYKDSDSEKAQQYIFVPDYFYTYDEVTSKTGGQLVPIPVLHGRTTAMKLSDIINIMETMINNLAYSEDIGVMSGDTKKAFTSLFTLSPLGEDYTVEPSYSEEVLMQIHNLTMLDLVGTTSLSEFNITQNPDQNWITYDPEFTMLHTFQQGSAILNFNSMIKEPANTMVASRLIYSLTEKGATTPGFVKFRSVGSEVVTGCYTYSFRPEFTSYFDAPAYTGLVLQSLNAPTAQAITYSATTAGNQANAEVVAQVIDKICTRSNFDWAPKLWIFVINPETNVHVCIGCICDWDEYTQVSLDNLDMLNQVALLSEFDVPAGNNF